MTFKRIDNIEIENARILFRNFSGIEKRYNAAGNRNFCLVIDDDDYAQTLNEDGWNVKILKPRDEYESPTHYIPVFVRFDVLPPEVFLVTKRKMTMLNEETIGALDFADIINIDLVVRPRRYTRDDGSTGIKAYLNTMYVTIEENPFAEKYANLGNDVMDDTPF